MHLRAFTLGRYSAPFATPALHFELETAHMTWHLATDANIRLLPLHEQLFAFSYSYLEASKTLCIEAIRHAEERDWSRGAVVLLNAAHAVELFLKAVLVRKVPDFDIWKYGHDIHALATEYDKLYSDPSHAWNIPFRRALPDDLPPEHLKAMLIKLVHRQSHSSCCVQKA